MANKPKTLVENEETRIEILEGDGNYHKAKFLVTTVDVRNRNGRVYERALAERETQTRFEGRVLGQSQHPTSEPDILNQFIVWEQAILEGDKEYFIARIAPTAKGRDFIELAKAGAMVSVSRRGVGSVREGKDKHGVKSQIIDSNSYVLQGVDVLYPNYQSDPNAHMIHFESVQDEEESIDEAIDEMVNAEINNNTETSVETPMPDNQTAPMAEDVVEAAKPADTTTETALPEKEKPSVQEKETSTAVAQAVQTERASVTATEPQTAPVPLDVIEKLTTNIQAKDTLITQQNVKIVTLAEANAEKDAQIKAMTEAITGLNAETTRLSKAISELNGTVQERTRLIAERDATLVKRNQTLADRQALLVQAHKTIQERDEAIAERNKHITQKNSLLAVRDENIAKLQKEVSERNATISRQDLEIASQDATIQERDQAIAAERASLAERDLIIAQSDKELVERNAELLAMNDQLLAEKVNVEAEKEKNKAFQHLFEKVQIEGEKASWFIFNDLRECATVAEVEAKFAASKARGIQLIEGVARVAGRAVYDANASLTDADELENGKPKIKQSPKETQTKEVDATFVKNANKVANSFGL